MLGSKHACFMALFMWNSRKDKTLVTENGAVFAQGADDYERDSLGK